MRLSLPVTPAHRLLMAAMAALATAAGPTTGPIAAPPPPLPPCQNAPSANNPADVQGDAALADRFEAVAQLSFPARVPTGPDKPFVFAGQAALLSASATLDPAESRYPRNVFQALDEVGDVPDAYAPWLTLPLPGGDDADGPLRGQFAALNLARAAKPDDETSWTRLLDLHVGRIQQANDRVAYLDRMAGILGLPPDVRSYALYRKAMIQLDQGRDKAAHDTLSMAVQANPLNGGALRQLYRMLPADEPLAGRVKLALSVLQANPLQPGYARVVAQALADAGLVQESLPFYELSVGVAFSTGHGDLSAAIDYGSELLIAGQPLPASDLASNIAKGNPDSAAAWYLDLLAVRSPAGGFPLPQQAKELQRATNALSNRVAELSNAVTGADGQGGLTGAAPAGGLAAPAAAAVGPRATTRPIEAEGAFPLPDVSAAVDAVVRAGAVTPPPTTGPTTEPATQPAVVDALSPRGRQARAAFVQAVGDLARLEIMFARKPDLAAPLIEALKKMVPPDDSLLTQLTGWATLAVGDNAGAEKTLAPTAQSDPLAALGLVQAIAGQGDPARANLVQLMAQTLVQKYPAGLVGAFLADGLAAQRARVVPKPGLAPQLQQAANAFPAALAREARNPTKLYSLHVEPVDAGRSFGQPLLAKVTLFNFGPADLTIGEGGYVRPGLLFQVVAVPIAAAGPNPPPPVAYPAFDTWACPLVVPPNRFVQQVVRVDQTAFLASLAGTAGLNINVDGTVATNPDARLGGYGVRFTKKFARNPVNADAIRRDRNLLVAGGAPNGGPNGGVPRERLVALDEVVAYVRSKAGVRNLAPVLARELGDLAAVVHRAQNDPSPAVSTWAAHADFALAAPPAQEAIVRTLATDPDWRHRQMALVLAAELGNSPAVPQVVGRLRADPQTSVRAMATAYQGLLDLGQPLPNTTPPAPPAAGGKPAANNPAGALPVP